MVTIEIKLTIKILFLVIFFFLTMNVSLYCIDMVITPINYYEKSGNNFVRKEYEKEIANDIEEWLNRYYTIHLDKTQYNDKLAGVTETDARRVAEHYRINYVLFGMVKRDRNTLTAEIKLYSERLDEYIPFFASDGSGYYSRLIATVCRHILDWFHTEKDKIGILNDEIEALREEIGILKSGAKGNHRGMGVQGEEPIHEFTLRIPVRIGYWTYIEKEWVEYVQGTVEATTGVEFSPELQFAAFGGMRNELSISLLVGYRYGMTSKLDIIRVHDILINPGINYYLNFYTNNWIMLGVGMLFEQEIWHTEKIEYGEIRDYKQFLMGLSTSLGYSYRFNKTIAMEIGATMYFYFAANTSPIFRPYLGAVFTILGGNYEK